jgi:glutaredoxin 3
MIMEENPMELSRKRQIEVFSAGCITCDRSIKLVQELAGQFDEVKVHDMKNKEVIQLATDLDIRSVPAVVITSSKLAKCCAAGRGPDEAVLREHGLGQRVAGGQKRQIEIFSAGCISCQEAIRLVQQLVGESDEVTVHDINDENVQLLAKSLDIRSVPSVVITSRELAACCTNRGIDKTVLLEAGVGQRIR